MARSGTGHTRNFAAATTWLVDRNRRSWAGEVIDGLDLHIEWEAEVGPFSETVWRLG